jgi:hypothetical protein
MDPTKLKEFGGRYTAAWCSQNAASVASYFLDTFGRPPRQIACECERSNGMLLGPVLNLLNGPVVGEALKDPDNRLAKILASQADSGKAVEELYLAFLCRPPTPKELETGVKVIKESESDHVEFVKQYQKLAAEFSIVEPDAVRML